MALLGTILGALSLYFACVAVILSPWFFASWEMWWFWPFAVCIFASGFAFCLRVALLGSGAMLPKLRHTPAVRLAAFGFAPFLLYALVRACQAEVHMDAERSFLLFLTPVVLAVVFVYGTTIPQLKALHIIVLINLCCMGAYGVLNHLLSSGRDTVMWVVSPYTQYAGRATGSYFCPDHFSGMMEVLLALSLGALLGAHGDELSSRTRRQWRLARRALATAGVVISLAGVWHSQSRGGGLTVAVILACALWWGLWRLEPRRRWLWRLGSLAAAAAVVAALWCFEPPYARRFKEYFGFERGAAETFAERKATGISRIKAESRYNMFSAAWRAWLTRPAFGIGPGMHQHLWPHFAASPDGDRASGRRPSRTNADFTSYEVHNDWLQLLEEYGAVGLALFLLGLCPLAFVLLQAVARAVARPMALGASLAIAAMAFHSLGDFNLQMPATVWTMAAVLAAAFGLVTRVE